MKTILTIALLPLVILGALIRPSLLDSFGLSNQHINQRFNKWNR